eukprot:jgi/Ulvmu1/1753/UM117_0030.1
MTRSELESPTSAGDQACKRSAEATDEDVSPRFTNNATDTSESVDLEPSPSCASASDGVAGTCRQCSALEVALVRRLVGSGRIEDARSLLEELKNSTDASDDIELLLGELLLAEGKVSEATACFLGMLADNPSCVPALKAVAQLHRRSGDLERAAEVAQKLFAIATDRQDSALSAFCAGIVVDLGVFRQAQGDLSRSVELYSEALRMHDSHDPALFQMGTLAVAQGKRDDAKFLYRRAVESNPAHVQALTNLGVLLKEDGQLAEAQAVLRQALTNAPNDRTVLQNLAALYVLLGNQAGGGPGETAADGISSGGARASLDSGPGSPCRHSTTRDPYTTPIATRSQAVDADAASEESVQTERVPPSGVGGVSDGVEVPRERGGCMHGTARSAYLRALAYDPTNADALYNLGVLEAAAEEWEAALFYYQTCVRLHPQHSMSWNNLGVVYQRVDNVPAAVECYEAAVATRPDFWLSLNNLGVICTVQGHAARAQRYLRAAIAANPDYAEAHNNMGVLLRDLGMVAEAIRCYEQCMRLAPAAPNAFQNRLLALNYTHGGEEPHVCAAHAEWGAAFAAQVQTLPPPDRAAWPPLAGRRLRVGYISPDLYRHSVSYFAEAPLRAHDRARVEVFVYCVTPRRDAKSAYLRADAEAAGCTWRSAAATGERALAELIRRDRVDVLVELTGHTAHNRLGVMRHRPAPVQVTWIGYPNSTGLAEVDYRVTDAVSDPPDTAQTYVETLLRLPGCFLCYTPMRGPPDVAPAPSVAHGYVTFGSFNALAKVTDEVLDVWCDILKAVPRSRLVLKNKPFLCPETQALWLRRFTARGVAGWRVDLLPLAAATGDHLGQYALMDIALDPWPYAGTTTTCEAIFMGVPVVTLRGACHAHNVGASLLTAIGIHDDWAAATRKQYVNIAADWAASPAALSRVRAELRSRMLASPLCDAGTFLPGLESELESCFRKWERSAPADAPAAATPAERAADGGKTTPAAEAAAA